MSTKLYVSNLGQSVTLASMRTLFGACGEVLEVAFAPERGARSAPSAAYVTMSSSVAADKAISDLHGRLHGDRILVISRISGDAGASNAATRAGRRSETDASKTAITQQYRDRRALTYELNCSGKLLTLRFIFPADDAHGWEVEARILPGPTSAVTAGAMTREQAFRALIEACDASGSPLADAGLSWDSVATALRAVRAL